MHCSLSVTVVLSIALNTVHMSINTVYMSVVAYFGYFLVS